MPYLFSTAEQQKEMLEIIGVNSIEDLFDQIPGELKLNRLLEMPPALTEMELGSHVKNLVSSDPGVASKVSFLGGGIYDHFIPAAVDEIVSRGEFYTAYTPYQAEASQGSLQTFFEFQTMICQLTGMDVSNASLYEGGTAVSEAIFMSMRVKKRHNKVVILGSVHPEYQQIAKTYLEHLDCEVCIIPTPDGTVDIDQVVGALDKETACLVIQQPNVWGCLEEVEPLVQAAHDVGALAICSVDPISLGILKRPSEYGADIVVAEGQSLGIPHQFGGPFLGILACKKEFVRKMPGRLIAKTTDRNGKSCYTLSLQTREQHIRREKATSNICTNQGLLALRATIFMSLIGPEGLKEIGDRSCKNAHYAFEEMKKIPNMKPAFDKPFFKEFCMIHDGDLELLRKKSLSKGFLIGPTISQFGNLESIPEEASSHGILFAFTEKRSKSEIDSLLRIMTTELATV